MIRSINPTESQIQCAIVEWANHASIRLPSPFLSSYRVGSFLFAIPNGGKRSITEGIRLKKEGVKKGVSDLFLAIPMDVVESHHPIIYYKCGLWIEVKTKSGKISKEQQNWLIKMFELGYETVFVRSVDEGIQAIKDYLGMK